MVEGQLEKITHDRAPRMSRTKKHSLFFVFLLSVIFVGVLYLTEPEGGEPKQLQQVAELPVYHSDYNSGYFTPIPTEHGQSEDKVLLGKRLFVDPRLSSDNTIACVHCHLFGAGGADPRRVSIGVKGRAGKVNSPSVFNSGFNIAQFWDGRAENLEEQVEGPLHDASEMDSSWASAIEKLANDKSISESFDAIYPDGITPANIANAIASFERALITPNSDFDRYLKGDQLALGDDAKEGMKRFVEFGCVSCHQGVNLGGNMFQRFGVFGEPQQSSFSGDAWLGRFAVTGREEDRGVFKVPGLRNVELTAPYFHDGSASTLDEAVRIMGRYQLGRELSDDDVAYLISFLNSLTGQIPEVINE